MPPEISSMEYCQRSDGCSAHISKCEVLCEYCQREGNASAADQDRTKRLPIPVIWTRRQYEEIHGGDGEEDFPASSEENFR